MFDTLTVTAEIIDMYPTKIEAIEKWQQADEISNLFITKDYRRKCKY